MRMNKRSPSAFVIFAVSALLWMTVDASALAAHEVTPMRVELVPQSGARSALLTIRNTRENNLPFEVVAFERITAADGGETLTPADADFIVFPPQGLINPGASQALRFEYVGDQLPTQSRSFLLEVREVPVTPPGFSGILTVYNVGVAVYVKAPGGFSDLEVLDVTRDGDAILFDVRNRGNDFAVLSRRVLELRYLKETVRIPGSDFAERAGNPVVPPESLRHFRMRANDLPPGVPTAIRVLSDD